MEAAQERPPYVTFETRAMEDRAASIEHGSYRTKDIVFALITPQGSKDKIEKNADEWIESTEQATREGRFPQQWLEAYRDALKRYKEGQELPDEGTPILGWQRLSPSAQQNIIAANIRTVEDLACANEQALTAIGMGARGYKEAAESWLATAEDQGKVALRNEALEKTNKDLEKQVADQAKQLKTLTEKVEALSKE